MTTILNHDRTNPREVYQAIKTYFPNTSAQDWQPALIFAFIPEGADPVHWQKVLRNTEYNINNPKPKRRSRPRTGKGPSNRYNQPGRLVLSQALVSN